MDDDVKPSEQRGGTTPDESEIREKGEWTRGAQEGIVPAELGGSDAPSEHDEALGHTTGSDEPATAEGIDLSAGDNADAVTQGGQKPPDDAEPDLKDVGAAKRGS
jgi:hypothetical protein